MVVKIKNPDLSGNVKTNLRQEYVTGTTLEVDSSHGFSDDQYIVVGEPGLEKTELVDLTATPPTRTALTVTSLDHSHNKGTPVYYTRWNQYALEYRTSSTGSWTEYGSMPVDLSFDGVFTEYRDASATSTYEWRYRYYSTEQSAYSDYSDTISASGWPRDSVGFMVREVRKIINDPEGKTVTDTEIIRFFNKAQDIIYSIYDRWNWLLKTGTAISTIASTKNYNLPSDFGRMHRVVYHYQDDTSSPSTSIKYNLKHLTKIEYEYETRDQTADDDDEVKYYTLYPGDSTNETGYLYIWPTPETAGLSIYPHYYHTMSDLDSYADETDVPVPALLEDYALAQIFKIRAEETKANYYDKLFREQIELLKLNQRKSARPMRSLWRYEGRKSKKRLLGGTRDVYSDETREKYW